MFLQMNLEKFNTYTILLDLQSPSNYAPLSVNIIIRKFFIQDKRQIIIKNSEEEVVFVNKLKSRVGCINMTNIQDCELLERIFQEFVLITDELWIKYSKCINITKHSRTW